MKQAAELIVLQWTPFVVRALCALSTSLLVWQLQPSGTRRVTRVAISSRVSTSVSIESRSLYCEPFIGHL